MKLTNRFFLTLAIALTAILQVSAQTFDGYALYNEQNQNTTYLVDENGDIAHSWSCNTSCNYTVQLKEDGNLVRGGVYSGNQLTGAAIGGIIQEYDKDGNVVWEFIYSSSSYCQHHDLTIMPNGNVLFVAWEVKSTAELTQAGYDNATSEKWPPHIVEIKPDGNGGADIVWEWHLWDHMIQDHDNTKDNYGVIADHPELMDVNAITSGARPGRGGDWFHCNGIDYNEDLDQIVVTSRYASELFIIDHSTTTAEAASHSGGNSNMGGDLIYRWGNPSNYDHSGTQVFSGAVHDPRWIKEGRPYAGYIQVFNNVGGSGGSSVVDAIKPPLNGYNYDYTKGEAYAPASYTLRHECVDDADGQSASDRMTNGNIFVNLSREYMYEADSNGKVIWQYNASPAKAFRYECAYDGVKALLGSAACTPTGIAEPQANGIEVFPNPSAGNFNIQGQTTDEIESIVVYDILGNQLYSTNMLQIDLSAYQNGMYVFKMYMKNEQVLTKQVSLLR